MLEPRWHLLNPGMGKGPFNIFMAGSGFDYDVPWGVGARKRLLSWHANTPESMAQYIAEQKGERQSFGIVDSGAFTVWNNGGKICVEEYGNKLLELLESFDIAANLDVIPGTSKMRLRDITPEMNEAAAAEGWQNYLWLREFVGNRGIDPDRIMPIYHQGESIDWLKRIVDSGCDYIGISPSNAVHTNQRMHWLDDTFDYLRSLPELPKTHGYAVTSKTLMGLYPWFSVDSASWIHKGGMGLVMSPFGDLVISDRDNIAGRADSIDGSRWTDDLRKKVRAYYEELGLDVELMRSSYIERWRANIMEMLRLERELPYRPKAKPTGIFDELPEDPKPEVPGEYQDCWGMFRPGQRGDVPMNLHDGRRAES